MANTELKHDSFKPSEKSIAIMLHGYRERFQKALARRQGEGRL